MRTASELKAKMEAEIFAYERATERRSRLNLQADLVCYMHYLSEKYYSATWMMEMEFHLWDMTVFGPRPWGIHPEDMPTPEELDRLSKLSRDCHGWFWRYEAPKTKRRKKRRDSDDSVRRAATGERFVKMDEWRDIFDAWKRGRE